MEAADLGRLETGEQDMCISGWVWVPDWLSLTGPESEARAIKREIGSR